MMLWCYSQIQANNNEKVNKERVTLYIFWIPAVKACKTKETPIKIIL